MKNNIIDINKTTVANNIVNIEISELSGHINHPRISPNLDVISSIENSIKVNGKFNLLHPIKVVNNNGKYDVIDGWQRVIAAKQAGLETVPCIVVTMNDEEILLEMVISNIQSGLNKIEFGISAKRHAKCKGGRGKEGGYSEFARKIGLSKDTVSTYVQIATVYMHVKDKLSERSDSMIKKQSHLSEIHKASEEHWVQLVEATLKKDLTVSDVISLVQKTKKYNFPENLQGVYSVKTAIQRDIDSNNCSPITVNRILGKVNETFEFIAQKSKTPKKDKKEFESFLIANKDGDAWDNRKIEGFKRKLESKYNPLINEFHSEIYNGDWRDSPVAPDKSITLLLLDPPYGMNIQSNKRPKDKRHDKIVNDTPEQAENELRELFTMIEPKLKDNAKLFCFTNVEREEITKRIIADAGWNISSSLCWFKGGLGIGDLSTFGSAHERIIYATKDNSSLYHRISDVLVHNKVVSDLHPCIKPLSLYEELIEATTVEGDIIFDAFAGTGTTAVAAKKLNRKYLCNEIVEKYYSIACSRIDGDFDEFTLVAKSPDKHSKTYEDFDSNWYTPEPIISSAIAVMGVIDIDPSSSLTANDVVNAKVFYSKEDDGLSKTWNGKIWLNPPYDTPSIKKFIEKLVSEYQSNNVTEAIVLVNNCTETNYFQHLGHHCSAICFPKGRINFWSTSKDTVAGPLRGQTLFYLGKNPARFNEIFSEHGFVCEPTSNSALLLKISA